MGFLNTNSMPRLVEKLSDGSNIKITGNSKGNRVGTVINKIVEKADDVTKAIEQEVVNEGYSFKVGTGDVDVSTDVQDGFGEVGVKGVTYQNLLTKMRVRSGLSYSDGVYTLNPQKGIHTGFTTNGLIKNNTKYSIIIEFVELPSNIESFVLYGESEFGQTVYVYNPVINKKYVVCATSRSAEPISVLYVSARPNTISENIKFKALLLEGDYRNTPTEQLPPFFEGIVGVGDKSKNLFNPKEAILGYVDSTGGFVEVVNNIRTNYLLIKPNTPYIGMSQGASKLNNYSWFDKNKTFIKRDSMEGYAISPNNAMYLIYHNQYCAIGSVVDLSSVKIQLEEGTVSTPYEPYYDGHKIEILSSNFGNLAYGCIFKNGVYVHKTHGGEVELSEFSATNYIPIAPNRKIRVINANIHIAFYDKNKNKVVAEARVGHDADFTITTPHNASYARLSVPIVNQHICGCFYGTEIGNLNIPYQEDKTQILLDEPLMRLPNGVCDEITRDGKLIRRVGKVVLDGSENWEINIQLSRENGHIAFWHKPNNFLLEPKWIRTISDRFCGTVDNALINNMASEFIAGHGWAFGLNISINKEKLSVPNEIGFKEWLHLNPVTAYYELAEPIVTELPAPYLRIFKDGHLTFNTLVAPESTHVVQLNKSAQIERSIREVQGLDGRVEKLESFYDDMILETSHKLNLLNYDFDYMRNTEDEI